jgi:hypothetical protein
MLHDTDGNIFLCLDPAQCPGILPGGVNYTAGDPLVFPEDVANYQVYPAAEFSGQVQVWVPPPPSRGLKGHFVFGESFLLKQRPFAQFGCPTFGGMLDLATAETQCGMTEYVANGAANDSPIQVCSANTVSL